MYAQRSAIKDDSFVTEKERLLAIKDEKERLREAKKSVERNSPRLDERSKNILAHVLAHVKSDASEGSAESATQKVIVICHACRANLRVDAGRSGRIRCPKCGIVFEATTYIQQATGPSGGSGLGEQKDGGQIVAPGGASTEALEQWDDIFDTAEFWKLEKQGLPIGGCKSGFRYIIQGRNRVFVDSAKPHILRETVSNPPKPHALPPSTPPTADIGQNRGAEIDSQKSRKGGRSMSFWKNLFGRGSKPPMQPAAVQNSKPVPPIRSASVTQRTSFSALEWFKGGWRSSSPGGSSDFHPSQIPRHSLHGLVEHASKDPLSAACAEVQIKKLKDIEDVFFEFLIQDHQMEPAQAIELFQRYVGVTCPTCFGGYSGEQLLRFTTPSTLRELGARTIVMTTGEWRLWLDKGLCPNCHDSTNFYALWRGVNK
jgi:hypothetical protein